MQNKPDFYFSKRSKRGLFLLGCITLAIVYLPRFYFYLQPKEALTVQSFPYNTISDSTFYSVEKKEFSTIQFPQKNKRWNTPPEKFDPNNYSQNQWMALGLSAKQAKVILKFTARKIRSNDDLKRIFVINKELFDLIKDSTFYGESNFKLNEQVFEDKHLLPFNPLELNSAQEEELLKLKGIGPFFAKQILKKRDELGGFVTTHQLLEVWKMDTSRFEALILQIQIDPTKVVKLKLNSITIEQLKAHPYISYKVANSIVKMRNQRNGFLTVEEIKESALISQELFEKLKPYLSL